MRKITKILLIYVMLFATVACSNEQKTESGEIAYIMDYNNEVLLRENTAISAAIASYAADNSLTFAEYKMTDFGSNTFSNTVDLAVIAGAKIVFVSKEHTSDLLNIHADYPDLQFVLLEEVFDFEVTSEVNNVVSVCFNWYEFGYISSYLAMTLPLETIAFVDHSASVIEDRFFNGIAQGINDSATLIDKKPIIQVYSTQGLHSDRVRNKIREIAQGNYDFITYFSEEVFKTVSRYSSVHGRNYMTLNNGTSNDVSVLMTIDVNFDILIKLTLDDYYRGGFTEVFYVYGIKEGVASIGYNHSAFTMERVDAHDVRLRNIVEGLLILEYSNNLSNVTINKE